MVAPLPKDALDLATPVGLSHDSVRRQSQSTDWHGCCLAICVLPRGEQHDVCMHTHSMKLQVSQCVHDDCVWLFVVCLRYEDSESLSKLSMRFCLDASLLGCQHGLSSLL